MTKTIKKCLMTATLFVLALVCFGLTMNFTFAKAEDPGASEYETKFIADVEAFVSAGYYVVDEDGNIDVAALRASFTKEVSKKVYDANLMLSKIPGKEYITRPGYLEAKAKYDKIYTEYKNVLNVLNANASEMYDVAYKTNYATYSLWTKVVKVRTDYEALSAEEKTCFDICSENGTDNLVAAEAKIALLKNNINDVIEAVKAINVWNVTTSEYKAWKDCNTTADPVDVIEYVLGTEDSFAAIETAMAKIAEADMQYVKGTSTDGSAFDGGLDYEALYEAAKTGVSAQKAKYQAVIEAITALTTGENAEKWVTIRTQIEAAEDAYDALDGSGVKAGKNDLKGAVTNYANLTEKRTHLDATDAAIATLKGKIAAIGEVVYDASVKAKIVEAEGLFEALDNDVKVNDRAVYAAGEGTYCVSNYATLVAARNSWNELVRQIVDVVRAFTGFIGHEGLDNENFVKDYTDAQNTYKALSEAQRNEIAAAALNFYNNKADYGTEEETFYAAATYQPVGYDKVVNNFKDLMIWFDKCKADVQAKADEINNAILELYGMYNLNPDQILVDPIISKFQTVSAMVYNAKENAIAVYNAIAYLPQFNEVQSAVKTALTNCTAWIEAVKAINPAVEVANFNLVETAMAKLVELNDNTAGIDYSTALSSLNLAVSEEDTTTYAEYWTKYQNAVNMRQAIIDKIVAAKNAIKVAAETVIPETITGSKALATDFVNAVNLFNTNYAAAKDLYDALTADEKAYTNTTVTTSATADYDALVLLKNTLNTELAIAKLEVALVNDVTTDVKFVYNETNLGLYTAAVAAKNAYEGETEIRNAAVLERAIAFKNDCDAQITAFVNKVKAVWAESYVSDDAKLVALKIKAKIEDMVAAYNALNQGEYVDLKLQDYVDMTVTETVEEVTTYVEVMDKYNAMVTRLGEVNALITAAKDYIETNIRAITDFALTNKAAFDVATEKVNALVNDVKGELTEGEGGYNVANITSNISNYAEYERVMASYKALLEGLNASMKKVVTLMGEEVEPTEAVMVDEDGNYNVAYEISALYSDKAAIEARIATYDMSVYNKKDADMRLAMVETIFNKDLTVVDAVKAELDGYTAENAGYVHAATVKMAQIETSARTDAVTLVEDTITAVTGVKLVLEDLEVANNAYNALHATQQALVDPLIKDKKDTANGKLKFAAALDLAIENLYKLVVTNGDVNNVNLITFQVIESVKGIFSESEVDDLLGNVGKLNEIRNAFMAAGDEVVELTFNQILADIVALTDGKASVESLNEALDRLTTVEDVIESLDDTYATDAALTAKVTELTGAIATAKSEVLTAAKAYVDSEIAKLGNTYATIEALNTVATNLSALETIVENLDGTYATDAELAAKVTELTGAIATAKSEALDAAKAYVDSEIAKLGNTYATIEALNTVATNLNTLKTTVENLDGTYATDAELATKVTELTDAIATAKAEAIAAAKAYVDSEIAKLNDTYATDAELLTKLTELNTKLSNEYKKLVKDEIDKVTKRIEDLEARMEAAEEKAAAEEAARKALEERLATLEAWKKKTEEGCNGSVGAYGIAIAVIALAACAVVLLKKKFN